MRIAMPWFPQVGEFQVGVTIDYSACYMLGCEAPSKGIDGGYHRVNKIGDACQSEPMHIPNIS
jgi:hypothetical protein